MENIHNQWCIITDLSGIGQQVFVLSVRSSLITGEIMYINTKELGAVNWANVFSIRIVD